MNWINLNTATLDSEEFLGAEPEQRASWLCLLRFCAGQENGGRIEGAKSWTDRKWQQVVRVTQREISTDCELWSWEGEDLIVTFYPAEKEQEVRQKREAGSKGGRPRKTQALVQAEAEAEAPPEAEGNHVVSELETTWFESAKTERKENGKDKENEKGNPPNPPEGVCRVGDSDELDELDRISSLPSPSSSSSPASQEPHVLPRQWRHIPRRERKNHRVHCNNRVMQRIGTWFGRKPEALWNLAEGIALSQLDPPRDDVDLLERYYLAPLDRQQDYRRRDLLTLLSHWHAELDRARIWQAEKEGQGQ